MKGERPVVKLSGALGGGLGYFAPCEDPTPSGFERVTVKKDKDGTPQVCIHRLAPGYRKKFRDEKVEVTREYQRKLKPFGSEKKPVHLRRCLKVDDKGRCVERGAPAIEVRPLRKR